MGAFGKVFTWYWSDFHLSWFCICLHTWYQQKVGKDRGVRTSYFPYLVLPPPIPLSPNSRPVSQAVCLPILIGIGFDLSKTKNWVVKQTTPTLQHAHSNSTRLTLPFTPRWNLLSILNSGSYRVSYHEGLPCIDLSLLQQKINWGQIKIVFEDIGIDIALLTQSEYMCIMCTHACLLRWRTT